MELLEKANGLVQEFETTIASPKTLGPNTKLYTGVDLGTAYVALAVVDERGNPVGGAMHFAQVVRDGLVVDYIGAVDIVKTLKAQLEEKLGQELELAGVAYPPGTAPGDRKSIQYVAEGAGFTVVTQVDEPTAANQVLGIKNGAVVDIGGGTTGIAIINDGQVVYTADEPSGGTHLSLVVAGAYNIPFLEAENLKTDRTKHQELLPIVRPVMQKLASIIKHHVQGFTVEAIYLVGGTCCFTGIEQVIGVEVGLPTYKPVNPFLVTPLGIALNVKQEIAG